MRPAETRSASATFPRVRGLHFFKVVFSLSLSLSLSSSIYLSIYLSLCLSLFIYIYIYAGGRGGGGLAVAVACCASHVREPGAPLSVFLFATQCFLLVILEHFYSKTRCHRMKERSAFPDQVPRPHLVQDIWFRSLPSEFRPAAERAGDNLKGCKDFCLKMAQAKPRI